MSSISVDVIRRVVREEVRRALLEVLVELIPYVDEEEQREIESIAGSPEDYSKEDFTDWSGK
ncbi:MAG: hypothetical protein FGF53_04925 [Candidatus Brockarchaeota archaeon]|nr:hypothetical protein [Candidatus Brockarchaeota archaeon]MBO3809511.1 hypothetical protein [Candidatus Brockarchaeota archaeon]